MPIHWGRMPGASIGTGRAVRTAVLILLLALLAALVAGGNGRAEPARAATNSVTFPDSTGEDPASADIASVVAANDDHAALTFTVNVPNRPALTGDMLFLLFLDTDANPSSGDPDFLGADYIIELDGPLGGTAASIGLFRWNGTDFTATGVPQTSLVFTYTNGAVVIKLNASELGSTQKISFGVIAVTGIALSPTGEPDFTNIHVDNAPDAGHGLFSYDVKITPPSLAVQSGGSRPLRPTAGKLYSPFAVVARSDGAAVGTGTVTCRATIALKPIPIAAKSFANGRATCSYRIPKTAKGKSIRGTITITAGGLKATRSFSARIG
jgi:hypothetical protein